ncbi:hypothetical protein [Aureimonas altamirensis]|uniref:hypothetical protein n=1 Tax=Aureimonas altamirensis TaxID=370622 RepID=UPI002556A067|nr:hypothetical protein [Aureimonas altamirensis]
MNERQEWIRMVGAELTGEIWIRGRNIKFSGQGRGIEGSELFELFTQEMELGGVGAVWEWPKGNTDRCFSMVLAVEGERVFARLERSAHYDQVQEFGIVRHQPFSIG